MASIHRAVWHPLQLIFGLVLGTIGLIIAWNHPLNGVLASVLFVVMALLGGAPKPYWLLVVPALLPIIDLAPWTGWIAFEEFDFLVLALASGSNLRLSRGQWMGGEKANAYSLIGLVLVAAFSLSVLVGLFRGFADAGGFVFSWYQSYYDPMNSLRLAKSFFWALLLLPLWLRVYRQDAETAVSFLGSGMVAGLGLASLATIWERVAFPGLLNFSSDYRTTGLFWEMHVGGAALDGFLALIIPFAVCQFILARSRLRKSYVGIVLISAAYASLTTFSRGVYAAVPIGIGLATWLMVRSHISRGAILSGDRSNLVLAGVLVFFAVGANWVFLAAGYRGLSALLFSSALFYPVAVASRKMLKGAWRGSLMVGVALSCIGVALGLMLSWGVYLFFITATALTAAGLLFERKSLHVLAPMLVVATYLSMLAATVGVASHWGGSQAVDSMVVCCLCLLAGFLGARYWSLPECPVGRQVGVFGIMLLIAAVVAIFNGGRYMGDRFSTTGSDFEHRLQHWEHGAAQLDGWDWILGKGMGRFPASYFFSVSNNEFPGGGNLQRESAGNNFLRLVGGRHVNGWGQVFRVSQRVTAGVGPYRAQFNVRADKDIKLHLEVCEKHLLYSASCVVRDIEVKGQPGIWQKMESLLAGADPTGGQWYAPRLVAFSVATDTRGGVVDIDNLILLDGAGKELIVNGDFSDGMARWFSSSDRHHMPWHMKNLFLHVFFEQGAAGLLLFSAMLLVGLTRLSAWGMPGGPATVGGLIGFLTVGIFDSLLDVPRVATLFYLMLLIGVFSKPFGSKALSNRLTQRKHHSRQTKVASVLVAMFSVLIFSFISPDVAAGEAGHTISVGPQRSIKTLAEAARLAKSGDSIEVDGGDYVRDVAVWTQSDLRLLAKGGRVRLVAGGASAEGKAIWVIRGGRVSVEGFDFIGAAVSDKNGAGIRFERGELSIRDCGFFENENGILTSGQAESTLDIENSEFGFNGNGDGYSHNLYVGALARLRVTGSYFHHAKGGHLLKSRALENFILANRLTDEIGGTASYELEFPNGGLAFVVGNIISQSSTTENPNIISYGAEGLRSGSHRLYLSHNTVINYRPNGSAFLKVSSGTEVWAENNIFSGPGELDALGKGWDDRNYRATLRDFVNDAEGNFRLKSNSGLRGKALESDAKDQRLRLEHEYLHPHSTKALKPRPLVPGAVQS